MAPKVKSLILYVAVGLPKDTKEITVVAIYL